MPVTNALKLQISTLESQKKLKKDPYWNSNLNEILTPRVPDIQNDFFFLHIYSLAFTKDTLIWSESMTKFISAGYFLIARVASSLFSNFSSW